MVLFKARVVSLLLFSAVGGAFMGAGGWPGLGALALTLLTGWLAASGASAWNQYIERRSDGTMTRTRHRPLVNGDIANPRWVPWVATGMIVLSVLIALPFSLALAFWLAAGAFIYVVIYTLWLKPRTTLNIVIGGAAGSAAVLAGAAAGGDWTGPGCAGVGAAGLPVDPQPLLEPGHRLPQRLRAQRHPHAAGEDQPQDGRLLGLCPYGCHRLGRIGAGPGSGPGLDLPDPRGSRHGRHDVAQHSAVACHPAARTPARSSSPPTCTWRWCW